ncbi:hypothetical protein HID58_080498 [Brassica napus]|uniref:SAM domain-containing protein n=1 Tax=Brassica napus TaxID=3708 RepID=A0ABQ7Y531_BRANA|nr:hypothetical protein HID58_080498 [Brassica napus]
MLLPSSPPPSTLSAFVGILKFVVGRLLSYWDLRNINKNGEFIGITLLLLEEKMIGLKLEDGQRFDHLQALANTNLEPPTASSNKTPDVDSKSILPAATVSYTVHVPKRAEEVDEAMPSFENEEKRHVSDCFKSIKPSSPLSLCVNEISIFGNVDGSLHFVKISMSFASCMRTCSDSYMASTLNNATKKPTKIQ